MILSFSQLEALCILLRDNNSYYYTATQQYTTVAFYTGCRSKEPFDISRWQLSFGTDIQLTPFKGNNIRNIDPSPIPTAFQESIILQYTPFDYVTHRQVVYDYSRFIPYSTLTIGDKDIRSYIFRYYQIRAQKMAGFTDSEIVANFGWTNPAILSGYLTNDIHAT